MLICDVMSQWKNYFQMKKWENSLCFFIVNSLLFSNVMTKLVWKFLFNYMMMIYHKIHPLLTYCQGFCCLVFISVDISALSLEYILSNSSISVPLPKWVGVRIQNCQGLVPVTVIHCLVLQKCCDSHWQIMLPISLSQ